MLFMVIETFRNQDGKVIYRRLRDRGRQMPDGLSFVGSWVQAVVAGKETAAALAPLL
jgi:hypothetical protein